MMLVQSPLLGSIPDDLNPWGDPGYQLQYWPRDQFAKFMRQMQEVAERMQREQQQHAGAERQPRPN